MPLRKGGWQQRGGMRKKRLRKSTKIGDKIFLYLWVLGPREKCVMVIASNI